MTSTISSLSHWYALVVVAGREDSIRNKILDHLQRRSVRIPGLSIICPDEEVVIDGVGGDRKRKRRMSLPGYILVSCRRLDENSINTILQVNGVMEFLGGNEHPTALPAVEVDKLLGHQTETAATGAQLFNDGDEVRITDGPLADFTGKVSAVNEHTGTATVEVEIFGRTTKATTPLRQLQPA